MKNETKNKIYKAVFECGNPSANVSGIFSTRELADKALEEKKVSVIKNIKENITTGDYYYANNIKECLFAVEEIEIDVLMD